MPEPKTYFEIGDILVIPYPEREAEGIVVVSGVHHNNLYPTQSLYEAIYYDTGADCPSETSFLGHHVIRKTGSIFDLIEGAKK